jgi:transcriptional regulator with XRE-family HTH domain
MVLCRSFVFDDEGVPRSYAPFKIAGQTLSILRRRKKLTQEKAAERTGISLKYYQALEGGTKAPAFTTLCRLRQTMDASWDELLSGC